MFDARVMEPLESEIASLEGAMLRANNPDGEWLRTLRLPDDMCQQASNEMVALIERRLSRLKRRKQRLEAAIDAALEEDMREEGEST